MVLDFEKQVSEIENKIYELKQMSQNSGLDLSSEIKILESQAYEYKCELYANLKPFQKMQIARHTNRPNFLDYVNLIAEDFIELHGDRHGADDRAMIGGVCHIGEKSVMLVGTQKGKNTKENLNSFPKFPLWKVAFPFLEQEKFL